MSPRNPDKNKDVIKELEKTISPILVVNNSSLKPYVELFEYAPENIYQQPLGSLVGFFEVKEFSDESAYIVNHLTAVLKKEYYINPKRSVTESLDSALHKVNMALSEIARIGNVEWLGKLNAAICVLEKNNAHFSVSGDAKIFLYRNQNLSEISEDLAPDSPEPHPLKTFINVSSGRLEKDDRLLITSADIFHILTAIELKKNFQRFEGDKFVQFLKTALSNQIEMIVSLVVEMKETAVAPTAKKNFGKKTSRAANAFSQQTFADTLSSDNLAPEQESDTLLQPKNDPEYTDKKTGHIYVLGEAAETSEASHAQINLYWDMLKEKVTQGSYLTKNEIRKRFSLYKKQLAKKKELRRIEREKREQLAAEENKRLEQERTLQEIQRQQELEQEKELERIRQEQEGIRRQEEILAQEKILAEKMQQEKLSAKSSISTKKLKVEVLTTKQEQKEKSEDFNPQNQELSFKEKLQLAKMEQQGNAVIDLSLKNKAQQKEIVSTQETKQQIAELKTEDESFDKISKAEKLKTIAQKAVNKILLLSKSAITLAKAKIAEISAKKNAPKTTKSSRLNIVPHFSIISKLFSRFSTKQKLHILGALALIFIAPLFIVHFLNKPKAPTITELQAPAPTETELLANEKNIRLDAQTQTVFSGQDVVATLIANNNPTIITKSSVVILQNNQPKEFQFTADSGKAIRGAFMNDLSLVLILTDSNKVLSFSPISTKFTDNKIDLANVSETSFIGTYLTYLYVFDQQANQIYRFPRADGGFGEKTNWYKDSASLANVSDMTIDDNIYCVQDNEVYKLFKGKKIPFALETSNTPVHFDKIYTTPDLSALYALDIKNSRIVKYSKDGSIIAQYYNEALKDGTSLSVDEKNNIAYIATSEGLISISL